MAGCDGSSGLFWVAPRISREGNLSFTLAPYANGNVTCNFSLHDDGGTADGGAHVSAVRALRIAVLPVNDPPALTLLRSVVHVFEHVPGRNPQRFEEAFVRAVAPGPRGADDEAGQALSFSVSFSSGAAADVFDPPPALFVRDGLPALNLSLVPHAFTAAPVLLDVVARDNGDAPGRQCSAFERNTELHTVGVMVHLVNTAPVFSFDGNVTVLENAPPFRDAQFLTAFRQGLIERDEPPQAVTFTLRQTTARRDLFRVQPALDASGALSFEPAPNKFGVAAFEVTARDSGGRAGGGEDTSAAQRLVISVEHVNHPPAGASRCGTASST